MANLCDARSSDQVWQYEKNADSLDAILYFLCWSETPANVNRSIGVNKSFQIYYLLVWKEVSIRNFFGVYVFGLDFL